MKLTCKILFIAIYSLPLIFSTVHATTGTNLGMQVLGEDFTLSRYAAAGQQLVLYVAPGHGFNERSFAMAKALADQNIEVWMVDLAENLFLTHGSNTMRSFNDQYLASIIEQAHAQSGKKITLLTSSYGAIPVLQGVRRWQLKRPKKTKDYLNGVILFSPELYRSVPALGVDPEFEPVTSATNFPVMIYQGELRNNRWQLSSVIQNLEKGGAIVYRKILPGVTSYFYPRDTSASTLKAVRELPAEIPRVITLLTASPKPLTAATLSGDKTTKRVGLDIKLKTFKGNKTALPLDLINLNGKRIVRNNYTGKVTLVNFWATWCPPCVQEIPSLNRLSAKMKGRNFELISINFAEEKASISEFLRKVNVEFPVLLDDKGHTAANWNIIALPSTFVIGSDGKIAYGVNAAIEWDSPEVIETLNKLIQQ